MVKDDEEYIIMKYHIFDVRTLAYCKTWTGLDL